MEFAYITVEDNIGSEQLVDLVEELMEDEDYINVCTVIEKTVDYFVIKIEYEIWEEVKDLCSHLTYLLLTREVSSFSFICNANELTYD